ncbi:MAG: DUF6088 family protein [Gemmatimonadaceae bacterium]
MARRIGRMKPGTIFAPRDLASIGSRTAIASALSRQLKARTLRQPARGLYQVPATHPVLGELRSSPDAVANALAGKHRLKLQPAGAYAANLLGLSDQVPMKVVYLTDGTPRQIRSGKHQIVLRRTTPRNMATAGRISGLVIQAFRYFGQRRVDSAMVDSLRRRLSQKDRAQLLKDAALAPAWIAARMREIAEGTK